MYTAIIFKFVKLF